MQLEEFIKKYGKKYSEIMGINVKKEPFKWFLASILFGAPIRESTAIKTYKVFESYGYTTPERIIKAGWDELVKCLDEGGYTRYDFKTADKILEVCKNLKKEGLKEIYKKAKDEKDLENRLKNLGKGIGDATISIFLREIDWGRHKINKYAEMASRNIGKEIKSIEEEIALMKLGRDYCRKEKCNDCPLSHACIKFQ